MRARTGGGEPGERPPVEYLTEGVRLRRAGDLVAGGASRQVCPEICAPIIRGLNGRVTGALVGPGETMPRTFEW